MYIFKNVLNDHVTMILWSKQIVVIKSSVVLEILALNSLYST